MNSTRMPGKVLANLAGRPMLWHVVDRVRRARLLDDVVVATTVESADDAIERFCVEHGINCFRGNLNDVLDRHYQAGKQYRVDVIVRVSSDCPLIDPLVINKVVGVFLKSSYDYVTNTMQYTYPDGMDVEVFSFAALERAWREAKLPAEREHVTAYIRTSGLFRIQNVENEVDLWARNLRWTVDESADLELVRAVYSRLWSRGKTFSMNDVLQLLDQEPSLTEINKGIIRNAGYYKSLAVEPPLPPRRRSLRNTFDLKARAEAVIPSMTQTFSKGPTQYVQGVAPAFIERGEGSHVWDVDGNEYIDYPMALGAVILGHNYPRVSEAVRRQIEDGTVFSLPHRLEVEVSETIVETIPCAEMVRFAKNGSDATSGAVRVARAYTGRDVIACSGYHGWQDWYIGTTSRNRGVPKAVSELTTPFEYNNIESLERIFANHPGRVAAVIMEPIGVVEPKNGFLQQVRRLTEQEGTLLIFDEIISGFRLSLGGAQQYFDVLPDLACFGKAMANGYPLSCVVGRRDIMQLFDEIFFSFTFGGEAVSLAAAKATIAEIREKNVVGHIWEEGLRIKDGFNVLAKEYGVNRFTECIGPAPRTVMTFRDEKGNESLSMKSLFQQECLKRGILFAGGHNIAYTHSSSDIDYTLRAYRTALEILSEAFKKGDIAKRLEGKPVQPVFRRA